MSIAKSVLTSAPAGVAGAGAARSTAARLGLALLFTACGVASLFFGSNYFDLSPTNGNPLYQGGLAALFLAAAVWLRRSEKLRPFWPAAYAFFVATMVWLVTTLAGGFGNWSLRWLGMTVATPAGLAVYKVGEVTGTVAIILALSLPAGFTLDSLWLRRGNLRWAMVAGLVEELLARGMKPTIFPSINRPDGKTLVSQVEAEALKKGY